MPSSERFKKTGRDSTRREESIVAALLAAVVVGSVLAIGTVHLVTLFVVAAVAFAAVIMAGRIWGPTSWRSALATPVGVCLLLALYTLVQAIPVPVGLLSYLAPDNADVWSRALLPFGEPGPRWASISLDPGASILQVMKWLLYASVLGVAAFVARRRGAAWGAGSIFVSGLAVALTTVVHGLSGATSVYGLYTPHFAQSPWHVGPLLNPNNLAGYLNLAAMCGVGLLLSRRPFAPRWLLALGLATVVAVEVTSASRGGFLALPVGLVALAVILGLRRRAHAESGFLAGRGAALLVGAAVAGGAVLAILGGTQSTWEELYDRNLLKIRMLAWAMPLIRDHLWFGIGRGAFETVFPAYRTFPGHVVFAHAENFPTEWATEWGVPVALSALVAFVWFMLPARTTARRTTVAAGIGVGIGILLLQNLFDLALEVPAISIALAAAMGTLWGASRRARSGASEEVASPAFRKKWLPRVIVGGAAVLGLLALGPCGATRDVAGERDDLHRRLEAWSTSRRASDAASLSSDLRAAMLRHPAEPYFPFLLARLAWATHERNPMPALERSFERASMNGRAHYFLAEMLSAQKRFSQARLELRMAVSDDPDLAAAAAKFATRMSTNAEELLQTIPPAERGVTMLSCIVDQVPQEQRLPLLDELSRRAPADPDTLTKRSAYYIEEMRRGSESQVCAAEARAACEKEVLAGVSGLEHIRPNLSDADRLRARLLVINGEAEKAESVLSARCQRVDDPMPCQLARADVAAGIKDSEPVHRAVRDLVQIGCGPQNQCGPASITAGDLLAARSEWGTALTHYSRACKNDPNEQCWLKVAGAAIKIGAHTQAVDALEKVAHLRGTVDPQLRAMILEEKSQAMAPLLK
jgi:tetratricopeptide (TPR) repeat protein